MNFCQNVCHGEVFDEFGNRSCHIEKKKKKNVTRSNLRKTLCSLWRPHFQFNTHET